MRKRIDLRKYAHGYYRVPENHKVSTIHFVLVLIAQSHVSYEAKNLEEDTVIIEDFFNKQCLKKENRHDKH